MKEVLYLLDGEECSMYTFDLPGPEASNRLGREILAQHGRDSHFQWLGELRYALIVPKGEAPKCGAE